MFIMERYKKIAIYMHWVFLTLAILGEVLGTSLMKIFISDGYLVTGSLAAMVSVAISYLFLSQATLRIPVAFANAAWEGLGMVLIALISYRWLNEQISLIQLIGIVFAVIGIVIIHIGYSQAEGNAS